MATEMDNVNIVSGTRSITRPLTVSVEGDIGSGKSTFLEYCREKPEMTVYQEPVEQWRNVGGVNLLANFYRDPQRWALAFQIHVGLTTLAIYKDTWTNIKVVERSLLSSRYCFFESMRRNRVLDPTMSLVLENWYDRVFEDYQAKPHVIVYLQTSPAVAYERMRRRARNEDGMVSLEYLSGLHALHEDWIAREQVANVVGTSDMPIFVLDADQPLDQLRLQYDNCIEHIRLLTM